MPLTGFTADTQTLQCCNRRPRVEVISADASRELQVSVHNLTVGHNFPSNGAHLAELTLEIEIIGPQ
ncbi:MAG: hypothetical protein ACE1ZA_20805, partial [Pseudomonadales bacterium]